MKHGILMMAHNNASVVKTAMRMLDDSRFTFFLLIDKKSLLKTEEFIPELSCARCIVLDRCVINWAGYSGIQAELNLMREAVRWGMEYLHFLQGADLPIKTPEEIDRFCQEHSGTNFIQLHPEKKEFAAYKAGYKHYFVDTSNYRKNKLLKLLRYTLVTVQKFYRKPKQKFYHGSALFSITTEFAQYLLERETQIRQEYRYSLAGDEVFIQTYCMNSPYAGTLWKRGVGSHFIDWSRPEGNSPRTFVMEDLKILKDAINVPEFFFARKFSETRSVEIMQEVERLVVKTAKTEG